ncbi:MAG: methylated-DNA--[protein]-cysteine S-methyltransferase [Anaerolineales bacterium]|nr:methylated-DNA--[protein]-cysteine S-methyltransferase [Anaerolineales bacterium]
MDKNSPLDIGILRNSPLGDLWVAVSDQGLAAIEWSQDEADFGAYLTKRFKRPVKPDFEKTALALRQLDEYLRGARKVFDLPIDWALLRPFQRQVLQIVYAIPYGQTRTYGDIAHEIGNPRAARAVGRANAINPMPLVIPCHRVIGSDGKLHGYGGGEGLPTKEWLLKMEGAVLT